MPLLTPRSPARPNRGFCVLGSGFGQASSRRFGLRLVGIECASFLRSVHSLQARSLGTFTGFSRKLSQARRRKRFPVNVPSPLRWGQKDAAREALLPTPHSRTLWNCLTVCYLHNRECPIVRQLVYSRRSAGEQSQLPDPASSPVPQSMPLRRLLRPVCPVRRPISGHS